mmetsp:Transcript_47818/g.51682  ORF Transcript_47818/g.51682 Transcript_47818/m.51682 type:complete len:253 (+) Transcript_47818:71-829(+)
MMTQQQQLQRCTSSATMWVLLLLIILQTISSLLLCQSFQQQPFLSPPVSPTFEQRMREQLKQRQLERREKKRQQQPSKKSLSTETTERKTTVISDVRTLEEYKHVLEQAGEEEKMVAVFWYAPWCKACKAALPGLKTIVKHHPNIKFIQVPVLEENSILHQGLNVPSVPYMHLYTPDDPRLVEERKMTRKKLSGFQKLLTDYEDGSCSLDRMNNEWSTSNPYSFPSSNSNIPSTTINTRAKNMMGKVGFVTP